MNSNTNKAKDFRILLVDDHILFRQGLKFLLADLESHITFLEADDCDAAQSYAQQSEQAAVDLILLDYHFPGSASEGQALQQIKHAFPHSSVVVLSSDDSPAIILSAIDEGAAGFIPKSSTPEIMIAALKLVLAGGIYLPPQASSPAQHNAVSISHNGNGFEPLAEQLSERQLQVLMGALKGKPNKVIARELNIAEGTVKAHLSAAYRVLDIKNRTEAVYLMAKLGVKLDDS